MKLTNIIVLVCLASLFVILFGTNPRSESSLFLILPFVLMFILMVGLVHAILRRRGQYKKSTWIASLLIGALPIVLLILESIGQLVLKDVLTVFLLFAVVFFYFYRSNSAAS